MLGSRSRSERPRSALSTGPPHQDTRQWKGLQKNWDRLALYRDKWRQGTGLLTAHCPSRRHIHVKGLSDNAESRKSGQEKDPPNTHFVRTPSLTGHMKTSALHGCSREIEQSGLNQAGSDSSTEDRTLMKRGADNGPSTRLSGWGRPEIVPPMSEFNTQWCEHIRWNRFENILSVCWW